jgi:uncharacterized protein YjbJ (UPF0337 family)
MANKDQITGKAKELAGRVKTVVALARGDSEAEVEGKAEQAEGKAQQVIGDVKQALHKAIG